MSEHEAVWMRPEGDTSLPPSDPLAHFPGLLDCVHCGLCLEACPTYRATGIESDSPRGRISLMRAQAEGRAEAADVAAWVDRCVMCRACEPVCPSQVQYHGLVERQRAGSGATRRPSFLERYASSERWQRYFGGLARLARRLGLLALITRFGPARLRSLARAVPRRPRRWRPAVGRRFEARGERRGIVALHLGCTYPELLGDTLREAVAVLTEEGFEVRIPEQPACCGALHTHAGALEEGAAAAAATLAARGEASTWILPSAGCAAHLLSKDPRAAVAEPIAYLQAQGIRGKRAPLARRVVHAPPCHLLNVLGKASATDQMLAATPGLTICPLAGAALCCGAGGASFTQQPEMSTQLGAAKAAAIEAGGAEWVLAGNPGCLLQIEASLRERGVAAEAMHPLRVLRESLGAELPK